MTNFIITILTSTVLSTIISGFVNSSIKTRELRVKINLEEKNKWYISVNEIYNELLVASRKHMEILFEHTVHKKNNNEDILKALAEHDDKHSNLIFLIYQCSYVSKNEIDEVIKSIENIRRILILTQNIYHKREKQKNQKLIAKWMKKVDELLSIEKIKLSKKIAYLIKNERKNMTDEITKNKIKEIIVSIIN